LTLILAIGLYAFYRTGSYQLTTQLQHELALEDEYAQEGHTDLVAGLISDEDPAWHRQRVARPERRRGHTAAVPGEWRDVQALDATGRDPFRLIIGRRRAYPHVLYQAEPKKALEHTSTRVWRSGQAALDFDESHGSR
jgi:hypothetical protein